MFRQVLVGLLGLAMLSALGGCYVGLQADSAYVETSYVPSNIEAYPHRYYEGRTVYYVNERWHYRDGARWAYYRQEPAPLYRQRTYVQQAPPANRHIFASPPVRIAPRAPAPPARRSEHPDNRNGDRREHRRTER